MKRFAILPFVAMILIGALTQSASAEKIRVMLLDGQNNHNWKETSPIMKQILENSGLFTVDVVTSPARKQDMADFRPKFSDYDVILSNYNGANWPEQTQKDFLDYMRNGGGLVIVHASDNAFGNWKEYNEIIGVGGWGGRNETSGPWVYIEDGKVVRNTDKGRGGGHGRQHEYIVATRMPDHPITKGLPKEWLHVSDELYHKLRGPAKNMSILATAFSDKKTGGTGVHEPALMTITWGKGRCFHTILGHAGKQMQGVGFQETLIRGTEWAATGKVTRAAVSAEQLPTDKAATRNPADIKPSAACCGTCTATPGEWVDLFDGKTLKGWTQRNGTATYRVENGTIVGTTVKGSPNSFLCTDKLYGDFELKFEVKVDNQLNSGVQIRSKTHGGPQGRVNGPQVEIEASGKNGAEAGYLYAEAVSGWMTPKDKRKPHKHFKDDQWNAYRVLAVGPNIKVWVNGVQTSDLTDEKIFKSHPKGFIGLQVHSVGNSGPFQVAWRNIKLREIK